MSKNKFICKDWPCLMCSLIFLIATKKFGDFAVIWVGGYPSSSELFHVLEYLKQWLIKREVPNDQFKYVLPSVCHSSSSVLESEFTHKGWLFMSMISACTKLPTFFFFLMLFYGIVHFLYNFSDHSGKLKLCKDFFFLKILCLWLLNRIKII